MKDETTRTIRIYKDPKMFWSEWIIFIMGILFISGIVVYGFNFVGSLEDQNLQAITLIVFTFVLIKIMYWVRIPITYGTEELIRDWKEVEK